MTCSNCGRETLGNAKFCNWCGSSLLTTCQNCGRENPPEASFCAGCARPLSRHTSGVPNPSFQKVALPKPRRVLIALVLSLLFMGFGQIYNGQIRKAVLIWVLLIAGLTIAAAARIPATFAGFVAQYAAAVALYLLASMDAVVCAARRRSTDAQFIPYRWYAYIGLAVVAYGLGLSESTLIRRFLFQAYKTPSGAMEPTILIGDDIIVDKQARTPHRGDVIAFLLPSDRTKVFVKRVIAMGGDTVEVRDKSVYLNGRKMDDPHARYEPSDGAGEIAPRDRYGPMVVPKGKIFVLGDNRDHSYDSRFWGFVDQSDVRAHVLYVYWSWDAGAGAVRWQRIGLRVQ